MRTQLKVERSNCTVCTLNLAKALMERPRVDRVQTSAVPGCIVIDHNSDDVAELQAVVDRLLHGFEAASNGEIVMITTSAEVRSTCPHHS